MLSEKKPLVSIIVRSKNEEKWIAACLNGIINQTYQNFEIILVDNESTDRTVEKAAKFPHKLVKIKKFIPGKAINDGVRASAGELIVCLSAHCIPVNDVWLENLVRNFSDDNVAGVYGRQEPMSFTSDLDKRDLLLVFGLDRKIQKKDSFFHNANSMFRRDVWEKFPFDEEVTNIEDRVWGREIIKAGMTIVYDPDASVYHHHGIHHNLNKKRCSNIVKIIENLEMKDGKGFSPLDLDSMEIAAIIPVRGIAPVINNISLLEVAIKQAQNSNYIKRVIVTTDNSDTAELARSLGAEPFIRDKNLSSEHVDLEHVYQHTIEKLEENGEFFDAVVTLEVTFPFRNKSLIDDLIFIFANEGYDSVMPAKSEYSSCWKKSENEYERIDEGFIPRDFKDPLFVGIKGLACVTQPMFLRNSKLLGEKVGILEVSDTQSTLEIRSESDFKMAEILFKQWEF